MPLGIFCRHQTIQGSVAITWRPRFTQRDRRLSMLNLVEEIRHPARGVATSLYRHYQTFLSFLVMEYGMVKIEESFIIQCACSTPALQLDLHFLDCFHAASPGLIRLCKNESRMFVSSSLLNGFSSFTSLIHATFHEVEVMDWC